MKQSIIKQGDESLVSFKWRSRGGDYHSPKDMETKTPLLRAQDDLEPLNARRSQDS